MITDRDAWLFSEGSHFSLYEKMGAHLIDDQGCFFAVWAPHASYVSVIGDFNRWDPQANELALRSDGSGIWEGKILHVSSGDKYKYHIIPQRKHYRIDKADPFAFFGEQSPGNASIVWDLSYTWKDPLWLEDRTRLNSLYSPISIYEVHLPSWRRVPEKNNRPLTYSELALMLPPYVKSMGFTHVEFLPIMEHPFYASWGYQTLGYYAPSSRYGTPQDFMRLIEALHQAGLGVILDWVPSHFPTDSYGLAYFDGTHLYEYKSAKKRYQPDWNTFVFDYNKPQVRSFLVSNAHFWLKKYHIDGLRMDAVASMIYLDYSRKEGEWEPNIYGGRENLEAVDFLKKLNYDVYSKYPYAQTIAEESTAWPFVSRPTYVGGLGFGMKWNMGWMHDTLRYMSTDPIHRKYHHNCLLFNIHYAFSENFILPLSHDEVVHEKGSLLRKMPGDTWQKFANLRLLFGYMFTHPGKKLLFMGDEFGQWSEWNHEHSLDWHLLEQPFHKELQTWVSDLNHFYKNQPALYELDFSSEGFEWINTHDSEQSVISFIRKGKDSKEKLVIVCNFTPVPRYQYKIGVPTRGFWEEMLNSDALVYGGSGIGNYGGVQSNHVASHNRPDSLSICLPPLAVVVFKCLK